MSGSKQEEERKNQSILVVDNEPDIGNMLAHMLRRKGYAVHVHPDPEAALSTFKPGKHGLAVLDFKMSPINGYELYEKFLKIDSNTKVLFLSGDSQHYAEEEKQHPANAARKYLHKPVGMAEFMKNVEELLKT